MNGYDLGYMGEHQIKIPFKTADGKKYRSAGYYPGK